jgi:hypothetical protein
MDNAMACWKTMPGPVERCGAAFEEICLGVCLQAVVNGVHLQHKRGNLNDDNGSPLKLLNNHLG